MVIILLLILGTSVIWVPAQIIFLVLKFTRSKKPTQNVSSADDARDQLWTDYLVSFQRVASSKKEQALLTALLSGKTPDEYISAHHPVLAANVIPLPVYEATQVARIDDSDVTATEVKLKDPVQNTLLLLYFGAFLLVTSVGLFVALGGLNGVVRTLIVAVTSAVLFGGGLWLYDNNQKLAAAGISFIGSGLIIAPLTGVAWYNLVAGKTNGGLIWLVTSIVCVAIYAYAFRRVKNDFIAYLLIGSFVSSIESGVLAFGLPTYGYAWALAAAAIAISLLDRSGQQRDPLLQKSGSASASLLVPLSIVGSVVLFPRAGSIQLAVTLALAGAYYTLLSLRQITNRLQFRIAAQVSFLAALANVVYGSYQSLQAVGLTLTVAGLLYALAIALLSGQTTNENGLIECAVGTAILAVLLSVLTPWALVAALSVCGVLASVLWLKQQSDEALQAAGVVALLLPFAVGQYALRTGLGSRTQLLLSGVGLALLGALALLTILHAKFKQDYSTASALYWGGVVAVLVPAVLAGTKIVALVVAIILLTTVLLRRLSRDDTWLVGSGLLVFVPLVYVTTQAGFDSRQFSVAVLAALTWNVVISLLVRQALTRWLVVGTILLSPVALGAGGIGFHWNMVGYSLGYLGTTLACLLARAIARGKLLVSFKVPIASYYTEASQAYVVGYVVSAAIALVLSLDTDSSRWLTTVLLAVMAVIVVYVSRIERQPEVVVLLPVLLQLAIFSAIRPDVQNAAQIGVTALVSVLAAAAGYAVSKQVSFGSEATAKQMQQIGVYLSYAGPALVLAQADQSLLLPCSLFIAGLVTIHYNYRSDQKNRELSVAVCLAAVHWLVYLLGVHNLQIHTHLLAVFLAGYAYWRYLRQDTLGSQQYIQALFLVVTIPLALQSLSNEAGGTYGLILIGEQVLFMVIGATLPPDANGKHFLLRWGLWTALAAILFQLRGLGWAFVSLLAVSIIGTAVYRLQKNPDNKSK